MTEKCFFSFSSYLMFKWLLFYPIFWGQHQGNRKNRWLFRHSLTWFCHFLKQGNDRTKQGNDKTKWGNGRTKQGNDRTKQGNDTFAANLNDYEWVNSKRDTTKPLYSKGFSKEGFDLSETFLWQEYIASYWFLKRRWFINRNKLILLSA